MILSSQYLFPVHFITIKKGENSLMKKILLILIMSALTLCMINHVSAVPFSTNGGFGISTVGGASADYATLYDCATDFNNFAGGCQGNWTIIIDADLTENIQCFFGNSVGAYSITMKPSDTGAKTINFAYNDPPGISGALVFGSAVTTDMNNLFVMNNITIDGSTIGATDKSLTLTVRGAIPNARVVRVAGDVNNFTIKNCYVINTATATSSNAAIGFLSRLTTGGTVGLIPDNAKVINCDAVGANTNSSGSAIEFAVSGTIPSGVAATGFTVSSCLVAGRTRGIYMNQNAGGTISYNTCRINQSSSALLSAAIFHASSNAATPWVMDIVGNVVDVMTTANISAGAYGLVALDLTGAPAATGTRYRVYNNIITGENWVFTSTAISYCLLGSSQWFISIIFRDLQQLI